MIEEKSEISLFRSECREVKKNLERDRAGGGGGGGRCFPKKRFDTKTKHLQSGPHVEEGRSEGGNVNRKSGRGFQKGGGEA